MIDNEREYRITKSAAAKFAKALEEFDDRPEAHPNVHPRLIRAQREAMESQLESLRKEIREYERLKRWPLDDPASRL